MWNAAVRIPAQIKKPKNKLAFVDRSTAMSVQGVQRSNQHVPRYDALEVLMIAAGVVFIVAVALVF